MGHLFDQCYRHDCDRDRKHPVLPGAGLVVWAVRTPPWKRTASAAPAISLPALAVVPAAKATLNELLTQIALFFTKAGAFVFGSGLAIVPFLYGGVVKEYGWLSDNEFLDAVAVAMITPGPVVITVGFIGYLVTGRGTDFWTGSLGAFVAALATFLPCYLFTVIPAPYFKKYGQRPGIIAFVDGVTAAAVGAIAGSCVVLGRRTVFESGWTPELPKVVILLITIGLLLKFKKLSEPIIVLGAAVIDCSSSRLFAERWSGLMKSWLVLIYRIPREPAAGRVYIWRKLKQLGAVALQDAAWVLPSTDRTREQFQWLAAEVTEKNGEQFCGKPTSFTRPTSTRFGISSSNQWSGVS